MAGQLAPAISSYFSSLGIKADNDLPREGAAGVVQKAGVFDSGSANNDVRQTIIEIAFYGVEVSNATTQLYRNFFNIMCGGKVAHRLENGFDCRFVLRFAGKGTVKVHQMQATGTLRQPMPGHFGGVLGEYSGLVHIALLQANAMTVFQVDGRYQQHGYGYDYE